MKKATALVLLVILSMAYLFWLGVQEGASYYLTVSELGSGFAGERIRVHGKARVEQALSGAGNCIALVHDEAMVEVFLPTGFQREIVNGQELVVEGVFDGRVLTADRVMFKCPSKYVSEGSKDGR